MTEGLEKGVPPLDERIETFKTLVKKLGKGRVIWRFDPLILTDRISQDDLLCKINYIGDRLLGYTEKFVFSFADIGSYRKVKINLDETESTTMSGQRRKWLISQENCLSSTKNGDMS